MSSEMKNLQQNARRVLYISQTSPHRVFLQIPLFFFIFTTSSIFYFLWPCDFFPDAWIISKIPSIWVSVKLSQHLIGNLYQEKFATKCEEVAFHFSNGSTSRFPANSCFPLILHYFIIVLLFLSLQNSSLMMRKVLCLEQLTLRPLHSRGSWTFLLL